MSLYGTMNTAVSGMNGQANRLSTVGDNIANADTVGYKRSHVNFSTFLLPSSRGAYNSGGVQSNISYDIETQGALIGTSSLTDLAIAGRGFFVVQDTNGAEYLTRAGSFRKNEDGYLVNASGFTLMGTPLSEKNNSSHINGFAGLEPIRIEGYLPKASATSKVDLGANLDSASAVVPAAKLPSTNAADAAYSHKISITAYDDAGGATIYDVYYSKKTEAIPASAGPPATAAVGPTWEVAIYRQDEATNGGFPYKTSTGGAQNVSGNTMTLTFDPLTNKVVGTSSMDITDNAEVPAQKINFDFSSFTQLAMKNVTTKQTVNGQAAAPLNSVKIANDGTVYAVYNDNSEVALYRIRLADVPAADGLEPLPGNIYRQTAESGPVYTGYPGEGSFGKSISGALETSNVDMASELTEMIQAQRNYTANSKVFQTGADLMDILVNLKR